MQRTLEITTLRWSNFERGKCSNYQALGRTESKKWEVLRILHSLHFATAALVIFLSIPMPPKKKCLELNVN